MTHFKVQLFWEGYKMCTIVLMVLKFTEKTSKPFLLPSQKSWTLIRKCATSTDSVHRFSIIVMYTSVVNLTDGTMFRYITFRAISSVCAQFFINIKCFQTCLILIVIPLQVTKFKYLDKSSPAKLLQYVCNCFELLKTIIFILHK